MKCEDCNKKISLIYQNIICKCKRKLCKNCKREHVCSFDYNKEFKEILNKRLVKVECEKIKRI